MDPNGDERAGDWAAINVGVVGSCGIILPVAEFSSEPTDCSIRMKVCVDDAAEFSRIFNAVEDDIHPNTRATLVLANVSKVVK